MNGYYAFQWVGLNAQQRSLAPMSLLYVSKAQVRAFSKLSSKKNRVKIQQMWQGWRVVLGSPQLKLLLSALLPMALYSE